MKAIVAFDINYGIGLNNRLPWEHNKKDMKNFYDYTVNNTLIVGRTTFETLPPLKNRVLKVFTSDTSVLNSINSANISDCSNDSVNDYIVIGGSKTYSAFLNKITEVHYTLFKNVYNCDTYLADDFIAFINNKTNTVLYEDDDIIIGEYT